MALTGNFELLALFDTETGDFVDLLMSNDDGLFFRAEGGWVPTQPAQEGYDGREIVEVDESVVALVDKSKEKGITRDEALDRQPYDGEAKP